LLNLNFCRKCKYKLGEAIPSTAVIHTLSLEIVGSWSELASVILPVLYYVGPMIAYRPKAVVKLVRLMAVFFEEKTRDPDLIKLTHSDAISNAFIDAADEVLIPSLSLSGGNCALSEELWNLVSHFSYVIRYRMYSRWKTVHTSRHPQINICRGKTFGMTRYVVKRLSKETVRMMGRQLGKLCHMHPAVVFDYILDQIQTFENLIEPVVESIRFLSNLEYDILSFCLIEHLASPDKQQLKASDGTLSPWLQSLATFIGNVFMRYNMELTGVLQYVANQLKNGKSFDLLVLREIIQNMSGIESTTGLTNDQIEALAGGETLRQEAGSFSVVRSNKRATIRLREALFREHLIVGLSILTAQQRQCIVYEESSDIPLKLAGQMLDQCQETMVQFGSFLRSSIRQEDYCSRMPSAPELIEKYHLSIDAAFFLSRSTRYSIKIEEHYVMLMDLKQNWILLFEIFSEAFHEVIADLEIKLKLLIPDHLWNDISTKIFVLFWMLTMYDINTPKAAYERELQRSRRAINAVSEAAEMSKTKRAKEEEQLKNLEKKLNDELRKQFDHVDRILTIFRNDKELLFADCTPKSRGAQMARFLQSCIIPRAIFTDFDATYCARFVHLLHQQRTGFFQTVFFFDKLFNDIGIILATLSENEANCFGRFVSLILETVQKWHSDRSIFDKECYRFPGFMTKLHVRNAENTGDSSNDGMSYESYRTLCHKWQYRMTRSCIGILDGSGYILLRNCLIVMIKVLPYFPLIENHITTIEKSVVKVRDAEKGSRDDISLMAASYLGHLKMRKTQVFTEAQFHNRLEPVKKPNRAVPKPSDTKKSVLKGSEVHLNENAQNNIKSDEATIFDVKKEIYINVDTRKRAVDSSDSPLKKKQKGEVETSPQSLPRSVRHFHILLISDNNSDAKLHYELELKGKK
uniref:THO complex subunit 2 n=1 Tax=Dracunculus medinensis TaxID=318479 RepID=A0A0N4UJS0_DRAME